ncbi:MAG: uroporphyrinogen-III C-methyltransferase [Rubrobacter sp.]
MSEGNGKVGTVYLVGSGPGDPGLITVKGRRLLEVADVIVYDRLAPESLLVHAGEGAELVYVGKKPGDHSMSQEEINATLVRLGKEGKQVVRLKGGDPYIFGRGSEEAMKLIEAGIPFEVVPGITSGVAAPAYAGIPVTHRGVSTSVAFITGHEDPTKGCTDVDWSGIAHGADTLVLYMGVGRLKEISTSLIAAGRPSDTPVAVVRWGTLAEQRTVTGTLADIAEEVAKAKLGPPAITVVGGVAALRKEGLGWFETRPLFGKKIVVTRARAQAGELSVKLESLGAEVVEFPTIEIAPPDDFAPLDNAIRGLDSFDWLVFTSVNGVDAFIERLAHHDLDIRAIRQDAKIAAIGPATAERIREAGLKVDVIPDEFRAEGLLDEIPAEEIEGRRILIPRAKVAREILPEKLREAGAEVVVAPAYQSVPSNAGKDALEKQLRAGEIDCVTFTASSTVENFVSVFGDEPPGLLRGAKVACIGPITADTAKKHGLTIHIEADEYTIPGLVKAVEELFAPE